jgi:hypothetical protein
MLSAQGLGIANEVLGIVRAPICSTAPEPFSLIATPRTLQIGRLDMHHEPRTYGAAPEAGAPPIGQPAS